MITNVFSSIMLIRFSKKKKKKSIMLIQDGSILAKAAVNVGGIVLNALAIEHFILRHPWESNQVCEVNSLTSSYLI